MTEAALAALVAGHARLGAAVCDRIRAAASRFGVDLGNGPSWDGARFEQKTDPYSQETSLLGTWQDGSRFGTVNVFTDGRVFAEYQILAPHPDLPGQFIEAVSVWGNIDKLRSEPVLLAMPE